MGISRFLGLAATALGATGPVVFSRGGREPARWCLHSDPQARRHFEAAQKIIDDDPDPCRREEKADARFDAICTALSPAASQPEGKP